MLRSMQATRPRKYFAVARSRDNIQADRRHNFSVQGLDAVWASRFRLQQGDVIAYYVTAPVSGFVATADVVSDAFEVKTPIWAPSKAGDYYATRYRTEPRIVVPDEAAVSARLLIRRLEVAQYLRDESRWGMLFANAIREIPGADFRLIEQELSHAPRLASRQPAS
jgi:EVE domain